MVNRKRVARLMREMGLCAIFPGPKLSGGCPEHRKFPYLLRNLEIDRPDQVWCADITYLRLRTGFAYLVAVMDWFSRYVLAWELSITLEADFCVATLGKALELSQPDIFNTDQGVQFTSLEFTGLLESRGVRISRDGKGRVFDNIFVERLWRSVKYEEVYLKDYRFVAEARQNLAAYFRFYNDERPHQALGYKTPWEVYSGCCSRGSGVYRIGEQTDEQKEKAEVSLRPSVHSPASALGSLSSVALSSGRAKAGYQLE